MTGWLDRWSQTSVALTQQVHDQLRAHLLRADGQEDLCFAVWRPSSGTIRGTALIERVLLPRDGERNVHHNVSFESEYLLRAADEASSAGGGVALLHSHPGGTGWQGLSEDDFNAEGGNGGLARSLTGLPMLGLTMAGSGELSARFWAKVAPRTYEPAWCESVRVVGGRLFMSYNPTQRPSLPTGPALVRTVSAWGPSVQANLARVRVGVVGVGTVGAIVAEGLARMGVQRLVVMDFDSVEEVNQDRLLHTTRGDADLGVSKAHLIAEALTQSATATSPEIVASEFSVCEEEGFRQALDCDVLFSCVDRPWARATLNLIAYSHLVPVVDGGVMVQVGPRGMRGAEWRAHIAAPSRRCLECLGQYDSGLVQAERDGMLDDSSYLSALPNDHPIKRNENVFAFGAAAASAQLMQFLSMVVAPSGIADVRAQLFHFTTGRLDIDDRDCEPHCPYSHELMMLGDRAPLVTGPHKAAAAARERRTRQRRSPKSRRRSR